MFLIIAALLTVAVDIALLVRSGRVEPIPLVVCLGIFLILTCIPPLVLPLLHLCHRIGGRVARLANDVAGCIHDRSSHLWARWSRSQERLHGSAPITAKTAASNHLRVYR